MVIKFCKSKKNDCLVFLLEKCGSKKFVDFY